MLPASSVCLLSLADKKSVPYSEMVPALSEMIWFVQRIPHMKSAPEFVTGFVLIQEDISALAP